VPCFLRIQDGLRADQYIDFSLMIRNVVEAIRNNAAGVENGIGLLRHLMVDEYQDVNPCQEELIRLLHQALSNTLCCWRRRSIDLRVAGSGRQQHSRVSTNDTPAAAYILCRRTSGVRNLSFRLQTPSRPPCWGPSRIPKNPTASANRTPQDFRVLWFSDRAAEAEWVAGRIRDLLGTAYDDNGGVRGLTPADFRHSDAFNPAGGAGRHAEARRIHRSALKTFRPSV
jgi:DNA helicase II / ATP-dependent DNA helicase PcrA